MCLPRKTKQNKAPLASGKIQFSFKPNQGELSISCDIYLVEDRAGMQAEEIRNALSCSIARNMIATAKSRDVAN